MPASKLTTEAMQNDEAARAYLESVLWPDGPTCPHCGATDRIYELKGKSTRLGVRKCGHCRKPFTVTVGTVFERSHIPLHKWLQGFYLLCCSKKGISSHQLHRILGISYKAAWFMSHRIREAMRSGELAPMGGLGGIVEVDETFIGNDRSIKPHGEKKGRGYAHKLKVLALVDRAAGTARTMVVIDLKATTLTPILTDNIAREARVMTDEAGYYSRLKDNFADHEFVRHGAEEWARGEGPHQHPGRFLLHLQARHGGRLPTLRQETSPPLRGGIRGNGVNDSERAARALAGVKGKRLTYETTN